MGHEDRKKVERMRRFAFGKLPLFRLKLRQAQLLANVMAFMFLAVLTIPINVRAELRIEINRGNVKPLPIAITSFQGKGSDAARIGRGIAKVIRNNLDRSGLFKSLNPKSFLSKSVAMNVVPKFVDWRVVGAQALVIGQATMTRGGRIQVAFHLYDVLAGEQMAGLVYKTTPGSWRRVGHLISDAIYKRLTGEDGYFDTRIVYVSETGRKSARIKRLALMDQDGAGHRFLTDGSYLVLTPRFSPTRQEITYLSYFNDTPRVYLYNIDTGQREVLGDFPGMTYAPRFSPDGNKVVMSVARRGRSDIYVMDLRTRAIRQLTKTSAIDTSPSFSPNGRSIVFNSDRAGSQQLYVMSARGGKARRISKEGGRYATPVWSPRGDLIAFTKYIGRRFFIGVMDPNGDGERLLTESFLDEAPTWAPNGRVIMFFRQKKTRRDGSGGRTRLRSVDLTGRNEREIVTPLDASDPAWSPLAHRGR